MTSVLIGGSRRLGQVNAEIADRLNNIMERRLRVLIGDADGFDRAAQAYLAESGYVDVLVFCTQGQCRNNVGNWPIRAIEYSGVKRGREFYTAKDDAMLREADFGLFAWDGRSQGTLRNVQKMAERRRPCSVYLTTLRRFVTVRSEADLQRLSRGASLGAGNGDLFSDPPRTIAEAG